MIGTLRISTDALRANAAALAQLIAPAKAAFVVKGNAYGHGLVETALAIEPLAEKLCVYELDEAIALRDGGITAPIFVMGPIAPEQLGEAIASGAEFALWDTKAYARDVAAAAHRAARHARVHVKLNTGLNRLGLAPGELTDAVELYQSLPGVEIVGVFSHLASAEELDSPFTMQQLERFLTACGQAAPVLASGGAHPIRHIAASAAAMLWPQTRLDMARFGIALYGLWPSEPTRQAMNGKRLPLQPALSYETQLVVVREIDAGEAVGYGTSYHAPRRMRIGIVPLGYANGIPRALSNTGAVVVEGKRAPIVGRVAMNMCFIDLSATPDARPGSRVMLIGRDGGAGVTADDWAAWCDTISYEILTRLPSEVARTYEQEPT